MDHQQNYEYSDPNAFGFINSFTGSDNYMQQQMNGNSHDHASSMPPIAPLQSFDPGNTVASQFISEPPSMMYHLANSLTDEASAHYSPAPVSYHHVAQADISLNSQKDQMFSLESPTAAVPSNLIQLPEPIVVAQSSPVDETHVTQDSCKPLLTADADVSAVSTALSIDANVDNDNAAGLLATSATSPTIDKPKKCIFSPEQNNMMKALGVMRREVLAPVSGSKKRRRRILQLNEDDSDDENELKKELLISPEKDKEKKENDEGTEDSSLDSDSDEPSADNPGALKARFLLKSAVIIHGPDSKKKKKKRILESDDEDEMQTSVDDIGLMESNENDDNDEEMFNNDIVVDSVFEPLGDECEKVVSIENPIIPQDEFVVPAPLAPLKKEKVDATKEGNSTEKETKKPPATVKKEEEESELVQDIKGIIKTEDGDIDPSMSVEAILENIKPMADDDEFFKADHKSDDSDVQFVSNEEYFGTPDLSKIAPTRRRRARSGGKRGPRQSSGSRKRLNKYEKDFVEGSSESEDTTYSESSSSSSDSSCEEVRPKGKPPVRKSPIIVQTKSFSVTRVPIKRKIAKKDRFYDKSRDIPNDIYFGDVNVPLHVLHTRWDSDADSSGDSGPEQYSLVKPANTSRLSSLSSASRMTSFNPKMSSRPSYSYVEQNDDPKLSNLKEFARISGIKINFARIFEGMRSTDDKCMMIRRILAQKGLQGEPTIAKCKQLRLDLQAKRESAELDKSLIIRTEGRTRRATRNVASKSPFSSQPSTSGSTVQPETLQTLSKIRRVVDSDSE